MFKDVNKLKTILIHLDGFLYSSQIRFVNNTSQDFFSASNLSSLHLHSLLAEMKEPLKQFRTIFLTTGIPRETAMVLLNRLKFNVLIDDLMVAETNIEKNAIIGLIKKTVDQHKILLCETAIIFADRELLKSLVSARIGTAFVVLEKDSSDVYDISERGPDFIFEKDTLPLFLGGRIVGYFSEAMAHPALTLHQSQIYGNAIKASARFLVIYDRSDPNVSILTGGRFFD